MGVASIANGSGSSGSSGGGGGTIFTKRRQIAALTFFCLTATLVSQRHSWRMTHNLANVRRSTETIFLPSVNESSASSALESSPGSSSSSISSNIDGRISRTATETTTTATTVPPTNGLRSSEGSTAISSASPKDKASETSSAPEPDAQKVMPSTAATTSTTVSKDKKDAVAAIVQSSANNSKAYAEPTSFTEGIEHGVLSRQDTSFFRKLQDEIDAANRTERCHRYGYTYNETKHTSRRIFFGALVSGEPWELLDIAAAEAYGIYSGMVLVEGNRTQNLTPRRFRQLNQAASIASLFGVPTDMVQVRPYVDETENDYIGRNDGLDREHRQRAEIVKGWKDLGMQKDDIGFLADVDEVFTRDAFRAIQTCDGMESFDYDAHKCHHSKVKLLSVTRVFESSPECVTASREWWHPDMIIGHCIEGIGDSSLHPVAPRDRDTVYRAPGYGADDGNWSGVANLTHHPLWSAGDFRRVGAGLQMRVQNRQDGSAALDYYTAFHFHNFMAQFNHTRFKYLTYGHPDKGAGTKPMRELHEDLRLVVACVLNETYPEKQSYKHIEGGFTKTPPYLPIYFYDADYRRRRHDHVRHMIESDEKFLAGLEEQRLLDEAAADATRIQEEAAATAKRTQEEAAANAKRTQDEAAATAKRIQQGAAAKEALAQSMASQPDPTSYQDGIERGILSSKNASFFRQLQDKIDADDHSARCARYGWTYNKAKGTNRRIFYGALVSGEPWELLHIAAAESFGIFSGMVFVEGNRTQNLTPRKFRQLEQGPVLANLFGVVPATQVQVRPFVKEDEDFTTEKFDHFALDREHRQRAQILKGWKDLGMQKDDIGFLADVDEIMTRDAFRAMQVCDGIEAFDYEQHKCHHSKVKILATTRVFETTPECITEERSWWHPDLIIGHCIEEIGDTKLHPLAPRSGDSVYRARGFGGDGDDWEGEANITDGRYPLWSAGDYRRVPGGRQFQTKAQGHDIFTGFHFHNFVAQFNHTRFKYLTYGHANKKAGTQPIKDLSVDLQVLISCIKDEPYPDNAPYKHIPGGFTKAKPFLPIYFYDEDYRLRRQEHVRQMIASDEAFMAALQKQAEAANASGTTTAVVTK